MNHSESIKELAAALSKAQGEMECAIKDADNTFFKSRYADLASVVAAIRVPLANNGLSYVQSVSDRENGVSVETTILHSSGEWFSCGAVSVPVAKLDAQGFGSALTYARRYGLSAAFGVASEDDDGNAAAKAAPKAAGAGKMSEIERDDWAREIESTSDKVEAKKIYEDARKSCDKVGDYASYEYLKKVLLDHAKFLDGVEKTPA